jgi:sugar O-acyltransferase (sialic acid O-acetyltransferase NeuD family)
MTSPLQAGSRIGIIGAGGLGKEVLCTIGELLGWKDIGEKVSFLVEEKYFDGRPVLGIEVLPLGDTSRVFDYMVIAIGDLEARMRIKNALPNSIKYATIIHPSVQLTPYTRIGEGSIVLGNVLLSCDVEIGKFAIINPGTTISHDSSTGDFFTSSPGVNISGNCKIGDRVFIGTNACTRNAITIGDDVIIGMGAVVTKDILQKGTYIGNPASLI